MVSASAKTALLAGESPANAAPHVNQAAATALAAKTAAVLHRLLIDLCLVCVEMPNSLSRKALLLNSYWGPNQELIPG
jgi:hypothetical protein